MSFEEIIKEDIHTIKNNIHQINFKLEELNCVTVRNGGGMVHRLNRNEFVQKAYNTMQDYEEYKEAEREAFNKLEQEVKDFPEVCKFIKAFKDENMWKEKRSLNISKKWKVIASIAGGVLILFQMIASILIIIQTVGK